MKTALPIDPYLDELVATATEHKKLVLTASPGSGKTTRFPASLAEKIQGQVWVLEPRRVAAMSAASRIAQENNWELGSRVGYQVRFESACSETTQILFLTEALLIKKLAGNPTLKGVSAVVLDEFHERSLHVDLAFGALLEMTTLERPDLILVVMSATLNATALQKALDGAPWKDVPGKVYPLTTKLEPKAQLLRTSSDWVDRMKCLVQKAAAENSEGDILVFLPGRGEIDRVRRAIEAESWSTSYCVIPLHGSLSLNEQRQALAPLTNGKRKILLATNVAESSLTAPGVRVVVDSGLQKISQLHPKTGYESLDLVRISKSSATQRAGRAAREAPGVVYRAWTQMDELSMKDFEKPEIERVELTDAVLNLAEIGVTDFLNFSWFEKPPTERIQDAQELLVEIQALTKDHKITPLGKSISRLPLPARLGKMVILGERSSDPVLVTEMAILLSEGLREQHSQGNKDTLCENDIFPLIEKWREGFLGKSRPLDRIYDQISKQTKPSLSTSLKPCLLDSKAPPWLEKLLLECYPDRLCRRRRSNENAAKMVHGRGVRLSDSSHVRKSEYFLALDLSEAALGGAASADTRVSLAFGLEAQTVESYVGSVGKLESELIWNNERKTFEILERKTHLDLSIGKEIVRPATAEIIEQQISNLSEKLWPEILLKNSFVRIWHQRWNLYAEYMATSTQSESLKWLTPERIREAFEFACLGKTQFHFLFEEDWTYYLEQVLSPSQIEDFNSSCPEFWTAPSGRKIRIKYTKEQGASIECRLQEVFGSLKTPKILGQSLTFILTAPNDRPVQVTRDIAGFWNSSYAEVKKELKARYPKHSWPDDPKKALPELKGRPKIR